MIASSRCLMLLAPLALLLVGCGGPEMGTVDGVVTMDGKPIKGVEVTFEPISTPGGTAMGYTDDQGHYALQFPGRQAGAPPGDYLVRLAGGELDAAQSNLKIPANYNTQSDLKRTVTGGENKFDFDIKAK